MKKTYDIFSEQHYILAPNDNGQNFNPNNKTIWYYLGGTLDFGSFQVKVRSVEDGNYFLNSIQNRTYRLEGDVFTGPCLYATVNGYLRNVTLIKFFDATSDGMIEACAWLDEKRTIYANCILNGTLK